MAHNFGAGHTLIAGALPFAVYYAERGLGGLIETQAEYLALGYNHEPWRWKPAWQKGRESIRTPN